MRICRNICSIPILSAATGKLFVSPLKAQFSADNKTSYFVCCPLKGRLPKLSDWTRPPRTWRLSNKSWPTAFLAAFAATGALFCFERRFLAHLWFGNRRNGGNRFLIFILKKDQPISVSGRHGLHKGT